MSQCHTQSAGDVCSPQVISDCSRVSAVKLGPLKIISTETANEHLSKSRSRMTAGEEMLFLPSCGKQVSKPNQPILTWVKLVKF